MATISDLITNASYELIDIDHTQWSEVELFTYFKKCHRLLHQVLIDSESELVRTGTGDITTTAGQEKYVLNEEDMGDLWTIHKVWVSEYDPMDFVEEDERYQYVKSEEEGQTSARTRPDSYYLTLNDIAFLPFPDIAYTINIIYYPQYTAPSAITENTPYRGLFDGLLEEGILMYAKNRNELPMNVEGVLLDMFERQAMRLSRKRRKKTYQMAPVWR